MDINKKIIERIEKNCAKQKDMHEDCSNGCVFLDKNNKCKCYDIIDYIVKEDVF